MLIWILNARVAEVAAKSVTQLIVSNAIQTTWIAVLVRPAAQMELSPTR